MSDLASVLALVLVVIGSAMQFESVSVLTGAGVLIIGMGLAIGGTVLAIALSARTWVIIVSMILAAVCVVNVITTEHTLNQRRAQIENVFGS